MLTVLRVLFFFMILSSWSESLLARENGQERSVDSVRSLARGGTYAAAYPSDEAAFTNPASLAGSGVTFQVRWLQLDLIAGQNAFDTVSDFTGDDGAVSGEQTAISLLKKFEKQFGKRLYGKLQTVPFALRIGRFEMAPYFTTANFVDMRSPVLPEITLRSDTQYGINIAYAHQLGKTLSLALALRPVNRNLFAGNLAFSDVMDFLDSSNLELDDIIPAKKSTHLGVDAGLIWQPGSYRYGLVIENIGDAASTSKSDSAAPPIPQRLNLGVTKRYKVGSWNWDAAIDLQNLTAAGDVDFMRLLHLGTEFGRSYASYDNDVGILFGLNEGYLTGGIYLDLYVVRFDLTNYAVELGEYPGQRIDRRWALSAKVVSTF